MAEARSRHDWDQTAALLAMMHNVAIDPRKTAPADPANYHPWPPLPEAPRPATAKAGVEILKTVFIDHQPPTDRP